ncbi:MAG: hypothetical protein HQL56_01040 [Magnetococcales bacterium]|nr:hypothetical protein [Magnetococcales bacterium]
MKEGEVVMLPPQAIAIGIDVLRSIKSGSERRGKTLKQAVVFVGICSNWGYNSVPQNRKARKGPKGYR